MLRPGGWAFQYANPHYPDVDDTAVVAWRWTACSSSAHRGLSTPRSTRAREWIVGMQSAQRRLGRVRADNDILLPQQHPVRRPRRAARSADRGRHRALRVDAGAARRAAGKARRSTRAVAYLRETQEADGSWFGRWGTNYIYGTWSVLCALNAAGLDPRRAGDAQGGRLAVAIQNDGRRLGRGRRELQARLQRLREGADRPPRRPPGRCSA